MSKVLLDELFFPSGIAFSPEEDSVIVAELGASRLLKYHIKGPKKGQHEIFVDGLPGQPDNITPDAEGLWVALVASVDSGIPSIYSSLTNFPRLRMFILRMLFFIESPFHLINDFYPNVLCQKCIHFIGNYESTKMFLPKRSTIVRVDWNGNILGSLHGSDNTAGTVSHVLQVEDDLYLGSPFNRYIAKVKSPRFSNPRDNAHRSAQNGTLEQQKKSRKLDEL